MMSDIRVLLVDDHLLVRMGMRTLLNAVPGITVIGDTGDGRSALESVATLAPNIVLMDISMPELNGLEATTRIAKEFPQSRVIILSMHANEEYVLQALRAGAAGYLVKNAAPEELELAIRAVARGETYLSPAISRHVVEELLGGGNKSANPVDALTPRQREILQRIAEGQSTKQIASKLNLSIKTIESHRAQLMERLDIRDVAGLVRFAIRHGITNGDT